MPTGFWDSLSPAARFIEWMQPKYVLDVGIGNGRMGFLVREYGSKQGIPRYRAGKQVVDGIEGYAPYIGPLQEALYDDIVIADALAALQVATKHYELVIAADILEHFDDADAKRFLQLLTTVGDVALVISPGYEMQQESEVNPLENHRSFWPAGRLRSEGARFVSETQLSALALFGDPGVIDRYAAETWQGTTIKDWLLPPELRRWLRGKRAGLQATRRRPVTRE